MNEQLNGVGARLLELRAKLKAREGKPEYKENVKHIREEIARLEGITLEPAAVASEDNQD
jgi:ribosomal protein L29